ncbi:isoaspartyl peptidase/L-asparaginase family protein [Phaeodactylibacter luteus]|uniref:Isoaspartyl peptidase n=1 Tax=Phaeodactylibacter luteus TaxID=1564516 RepID=A0A5C6RU02_9BACT|nr:isoaspartyl peptidase/L-asparaginase [Phaeodactylibacter luteus]TXB65577.1 isoaspartyl peptidase/L-asparaginase [Phaeodactylibacter luteus]
MSYTLAVHGGAGTIRRTQMTTEQEAAHHDALRLALNAGTAVLSEGGTAVDAVARAVTVLENAPCFNAGRGAVFTHDGRHEMDASIMCGRTLEAGAVALVEHLKNPVLLARAVMEQSPYVFLSGPGAMAFARELGLPEASPDYFFTPLRHEQLQQARAAKKIQLDHSDKFGTVGAVALDLHGNLAAATSTGGLTNKQFGRIGDSAVIGAGNYANNRTCAVSCTGFGEYYLRGVVAYDVSCLMEYAGLSLQQAAERVILEKQLALGGDGGLIAVDAQGQVALPFNSEGMYRGWARAGAPPVTAIYEAE